MPGAQRPKTVKGAQSDPNYVSRLLLDCVPVFHKIITVCLGPKTYSYATVYSRTLAPLSARVTLWDFHTFDEQFLKPMHNSAWLVCSGAWVAGNNVSILPDFRPHRLQNLDPRVGHTVDVLSPIISVLCHSGWLFHGESCPRLDVVHPDRAWPFSPACT